VEPEPPQEPVAALAPANLLHEAEVNHYESAADYESERSDFEEPLVARIEDSVSGDRPAPQEVISAADEPETQHEDFYAPDDAEGYYEEAPETYAAAENAAPLVSPDAAASITAQFQSLAASMVINDSGLLHDYAREMLRPMLKAWLDDNLPVLVERLVRAEIERVARGGRR
jgi:cell pole-organizing protein PopZ